MDWSLMLNFKKILCSISVLCFSSGAWASEETGYYTFANYRYFGPALATDNYSHAVDTDNVSATRFYPNIAKLQYNQFKNIARTVKTAVGYGDWDKEYRVMGGFEYDGKRTKSSKGNYGYEQGSGSFYFLSDKAVYDQKIYLGGGGVFSKYDGDFTNDLKQREDNVQAVAYAVYNDAEKQVRFSSRAYLGYGKNDVSRRSQTGVYKDDFNNFYYGWENSVSKTFQRGMFYVQPQVDINGLGVRRGAFDDGMYSLKSSDSFLWYGFFDLYFGIKGKDAFDNGYNLKVGPEFTRVFSDPYDSFYAMNGTDVLYFKNCKDKRDYIIWKAYLNYGFSNGFGIYGDFRYYVKDADSTAYSLGINYRF